jgi:hypothetical protein
MSYRFVDSFRAGQEWPCSKAVYELIWHITLLSVQWIKSLNWTDELSETCRVSWQNKFVKLVHLVGFIIKKSYRNIARKEAISSLKTVILNYILPVQNKLHHYEFLNSSTESIPQRFISFNIISPFVCHKFSHSFSPCFCSCFLSARHSRLCSRLLYKSFFLSYFAFPSSFLSIKVQKFN